MVVGASAACVRTYTDALHQNVAFHLTAAWNESIDESTAASQYPKQKRGRVSLLYLLSVVVYRLPYYATIEISSNLALSLEYTP